MKKLIDKWRTGAEQCLRGEMGYQVGGVSRIFTKAHIWNIQFNTHQQLPFSSSDWIILYGNTIIWGIITCSPGDLVYSSSHCWRRLEHSPESNPENWFLTIHDNSPPRVPHSSLTLLQINLKAEPDSSSRHTPYKQPLFLQKALFVSYEGFKASTALVTRATV